MVTSMVVMGGSSSKDSTTMSVLVPEVELEARRVAVVVCAPVSECAVAATSRAMASWRAWRRWEQPHAAAW